MYPITVYPRIAYRVHVRVDPELIVSAEQAVARACERSGVEVHLAQSPSELHLVREVCDAVWPAVSGSTQLQPNLLKAITYSGGYASIALADGEPVGAAVALPGRHRDATTGWIEVLHSHMAGVVSGARDRGIGTALKQHQRLWALQQQLPVISWTFDPLVRRNAVFNLRNLGVEVARYEVNFYGAMDDELNHGDETDRLLAWWPVASARAVRAAIHPLPAINTTVADLGSTCQIIEIPEDIVGLRQANPSEAMEWRLRVRREFQKALTNHEQVLGVDDCGNYVLAPEGSTEP